MIEAFLEDFAFKIEKKKGILHVNEESIEPDIHRLNDRLWHIIHNNRSFMVFVQRIDRDKRLVTLSVNGKRTQVRLESRIEKLLKALGMEGTLHKKMQELRAPMPGLIHSIKTLEGAEVQAGDPLLILEAMKMENVIKSEGDGKVARIHVKEKDSVEKNALLITFA